MATFTHSSKFRVMLMDISQAAFGLDMRSASRIYFISPVLNPQVQAQAIGRARRISQQKPVTVETLVLKGSIEEVIVSRSKQMTQKEQRKVVSSVIEDKTINDWIKNVRIMPMEKEPLVQEHGAEPQQAGLAQTAMLKTPQFVFGIGFGRDLNQEDDLLTNSPASNTQPPPSGRGQEEEDGRGRRPGPLPVRVPFKIRLGGGRGVRRSESPSAASASVTTTRESTPLEQTTAAAASAADSSVAEHSGEMEKDDAEIVDKRPRKKVRVAFAD